MYKDYQKEKQEKDVMSRKNLWLLFVTLVHSVFDFYFIYTFIYQMM